MLSTSGCRSSIIQLFFFVFVNLFNMLSANEVYLLHALYNISKLVLAFALQGKLTK